MNGLVTRTAIWWEDLVTLLRVLVVLFQVMGAKQLQSISLGFSPLSPLPVKREKKNTKAVFRQPSNNSHSHFEFESMSMCCTWAVHVGPVIDKGPVKVCLVSVSDPIRISIIFLHQYFTNFTSGTRLKMKQEGNKCDSYLSTPRSSSSKHKLLLGLFLKSHAGLIVYHQHFEQ